MTKKRGVCQQCGRDRNWKDDGKPCEWGCGHDHIIDVSEYIRKKESSMVKPLFLTKKKSSMVKPLFLTELHAGLTAHPGDPKGNGDNKYILNVEYNKDVRDKVLQAIDELIFIGDEDSKKLLSNTIDGLNPDNWIYVENDEECECIKYAVIKKNESVILISKSLEENKLDIYGKNKEMTINKDSLDTFLRIEDLPLLETELLCEIHSTAKAGLAVKLLKDVKEVKRISHDSEKLITFKYKILSWIRLLGRAFAAGASLGILASLYPVVAMLLPLLMTIVGIIISTDHEKQETIRYRDALIRERDKLKNELKNAKTSKGKSEINKLIRALDKGIKELDRHIVDLS